VCNPPILDIDENADPCDENTPIILGNNNIQTDADGNQSHVGVGTSTTRGSAQSEVNDNDVPGILQVCYYAKVTYRYTWPYKRCLKTILILGGKKRMHDNGNEELI